MKNLVVSTYYETAVTGTMIQNVGKDWYPDLTGSESRQQVERWREGARISRDLRVSD
jgi:hypothetical protein